MISREEVLEVIGVYQKSWESQDPDLILTIFTSDAKYHERTFEKAHLGHDEIREYWVSKVVNSQSDIKFKLLNLYLEGETAIAEWEATFNHLEKGKNYIMREVAILDFEGNKIKHLREYWQAKALDL